MKKGEHSLHILINIHTCHLLDKNMQILLEFCSSVEFDEGFLGVDPKNLLFGEIASLLG